MKNNKLLLITFCTLCFISCGTKDFLQSGLDAGDKLTTVNDNSSVANMKEINLTPNAPLLTTVDKSIQDIVTKRIHMELNPDIEHLRNTGQVIPDDIPPVNFTSLKFYPVIARPRVLSDNQGDNFLSVNKEYAVVSGKTENGENIFILVRYENQSEIFRDVNSADYRRLVSMRGKEAVEKSAVKFLNRQEIDHWRVIVFQEGDIMFQLMDYARQQSDDGKFFILTKGKNHSEVCYFKDGKPFSCRKSTEYDAIRVRDFAGLLR